MQSYQKLSLGLSPFSLNRDPIDIKASIIRVILEVKEQINHFFICKKVAVNHIQLIRYLSDLYSLGLIEKKKHSVRGRKGKTRNRRRFYYVVTEKGKTFLDTYHKMIKLVVVT